jgi:hypothetical protein
MNSRVIACVVITFHPSLFLLLIGMLTLEVLDRWLQELEAMTAEYVAAEKAADEAAEKAAHKAMKAEHEAAMFTWLCSQFALDATGYGDPSAQCTHGRGCCFCVHNHISHTTLFMGKDKDDQTGVKNKVPEHKVTRRSRTRTNEEAAYHDAEEGARPVRRAGKRRKRRQGR